MTELFIMASHCLTLVLSWVAWHWLESVQNKSLMQPSLYTSFHCEQSRGMGANATPSQQAWTERQGSVDRGSTLSSCHWDCFRTS